jgi:hypothetical protein
VERKTLNEVNSGIERGKVPKGKEENSLADGREKKKQRRRRH